MNGICKIRGTTIKKTKTKKTKKKTEVGKTLCQGLRRMYKLFAIMDKKTCHSLEILETFYYRTYTEKLKLTMLSFIFGTESGLFFFYFVSAATEATCR